MAVNMRGTKRPRRGQATLEFALSATVFVAVLMVGIYFGEVSFTSLKAQEAAQAALWDSTAYKMHRMDLFTYDTAPSAQAVNEGVENANRRYADFDGRESVNGSGEVLQSLLQANGMRVECTTGGAYTHVPAPYLLAAYRDNGGVQCQAQADFNAVRIPEAFLSDDNGFFREKSLGPRPMTVCGVGRAIGGACSARFAMLIDDWGLADGLENRSCPSIAGLPCYGGNEPYYGLVSRAYIPAMAPVVIPLSATMLSLRVVGPHPFVNIDQFMPHMSYVGEEMAFQQPVAANPTEGSLVWETTPFATSFPVYGVSYGQRAAKGGCYLGLNCNAPNGSGPYTSP